MFFEMVGEIDEQVTKYLTCPVCLEIPKTEIFQCLGGHTICKCCCGTATVCPQCGIPYANGKIRNRSLELLLAYLKRECPFKEAGCTEVVRRRDLNKHLNSCIYSEKHIQLCRVLGLQCDHWSNTEKPDCVADHLQKIHDFVRKCGPAVHIRMNNFVTMVEVDNNEGVSVCMWAPVILDCTYKVAPGSSSLSTSGDMVATCTKKFLVLSLFYGEDNTVAWLCVILSGDAKEDAEQCEVQFFIRSQNDKISPLQWKVTPTTVFQLSEVLPCIPFRVPISLLRKHYTDPNNGRLMVRFSVEKLKLTCSSSSGSTCDKESSVDSESPCESPTAGMGDTSCTINFTTRNRHFQTL